MSASSSLISSASRIGVPGQGLPVMETFATIQGEGAFTGHAAWFIRLGGCDVGCTWCDVKDSWDANVHPVREVDELVAEALGQPARIAIVTGGEPLMHDLGPLTDALIAAGFRTHIETSGTHPPSGTWHWICLSPKKFKEPLPGIHERADELKVIVYHRSDLDWAEDHAARVRSICRLFLQPEWSKRATMSPLIVERVTRDPRWQISLQTHKYLDIP
ncbi:MAG: radical SAM protein [Flavobacteriales bacterium]|nr:radical SAM protein [Flavobacteriales bacterium]